MAAYGDVPEEIQLAKTGIVRWQDPPARGRDRYANAAAELKANPGQWGVVQEVDESKSTNSSYIRKALVSVLGEGNVEVREAAIDGGKRAVFARYTGSAAAAEK